MYSQPSFRVRSHVEYGFLLRDPPLPSPLLPSPFQYKVLTFSAGSLVSKLDIGCLRWILLWKDWMGRGVKVYEGGEKRVWIRINVGKFGNRMKGYFSKGFDRILSLLDAKWFLWNRRICIIFFLYFFLIDKIEDLIIEVAIALN